MGVDVGKDLHVVISRRVEGQKDLRHVVYLGVQQSYAELVDLMKRFSVRRVARKSRRKVGAQN